MNTGEMRLKVWCKRHWQPYFDGRANGARATYLLTSAFFNSVAVLKLTPEQFTAQMEKYRDAGTTLCCLLEEQDHDELVINAGPADPDRDDIPFDKITVLPRYVQEPAKNDPKP